MAAVHALTLRTLMGYDTHEVPPNVWLGRSLSYREIKLKRKCITTERRKIIKWGTNIENKSGKGENRFMKRIRQKYMLSYQFLTRIWYVKILFPYFRSIPKDNQKCRYDDFLSVASSKLCSEIHHINIRPKVQGTSGDRTHYSGVINQAKQTC